MQCPFANGVCNQGTGSQGTECEFGYVGALCDVLAWFATCKMSALCETKIAPDVSALLFLGSINFTFVVKETSTTKGAEALKMLMKKKKNMASASGYCLHDYISAPVTASTNVSLVLSLPPCRYHCLSGSITASPSLSLPHRLYHCLTVFITSSPSLSLPTCLYHCLPVCITVSLVLSLPICLCHCLPVFITASLFLSLDLCSLRPAAWMCQH